MSVETFGIIGTGGIAKTHALAVKSIEGAELVALFNHNAEKGRAFGEEYGCRAYDDLDSFLAADIGTVIITTPSGAHMEYAIKALESGHDIMVEKPLEVTEERCRKIIECARANNRRAGVIFQNRYFSSIQAVKKAVDEGRFGRMVLASASMPIFRSQEYYDSAAWRGTIALDGGGVLMNQGIHTVDLLYYLAGDVLAVSAYKDCLSHERIEVEDTAVVALKYSSGAMGSITATTSDYPGYPRRIELYGTDGSVVIENEIIKVWQFKEERAEDEEKREKFSKSESAFTTNTGPQVDFICHKREYEEYIKAKQDGRAFAIDGVEGTKAVSIICAAYRSAETGLSVKL